MLGQLTYFIISNEGYISFYRRSILILVQFISCYKYCNTSLWKVGIWYFYFKWKFNIRWQISYRQMLFLSLALRVFVDFSSKRVFPLFSHDHNSWRKRPLTSLLTTENITTTGNAVIHSTCRPGPVNLKWSSITATVLYSGDSLIL